MLLEKIVFPLLYSPQALLDCQSLEKLVGGGGTGRKIYDTLGKFTIYCFMYMHVGVHV